MREEGDQWTLGQIKNEKRHRVRKRRKKIETWEGEVKRRKRTEMEKKRESGRGRKGMRAERGEKKDL